MIKLTKIVDRFFKVCFFGTGVGAAVATGVSFSS
jgi:hypothetical protein